MKKFTKVFITLLTLGILTTTVATTPVSAKTEKRFVTTSTKDYYKTDKGNWYLSRLSKENYSKKGNWLGYEFQNYSSEGKKEFSYKYAIQYDKKNRYKVTKSYSNGKLESANKYSYKGKKEILKKYDGNNYQGKEVSKNTKRKTTTTYYNAKGKKYGTRVTTYNKQGALLKIVRKVNGKIVEQWTHTYKKGVLTKRLVKTYNSDGTLSSYDEETYKKGKQLKSVYRSYDESGKITLNIEGTYKKGKLVKRVEKNYTEGKVESTAEYSYSYKGKTTTETYQYNYNNGTDTDKHVSKYKEDKVGHRITSWTKYYNNGKLSSTYTYKYKKYTSGAAKGCVKQEIELHDGVEYKKTEYNVKVLKYKVK